jgi:cell division protein FtsB
MREFQGRNKYKRILYSKGAAVVLGIFILLVSRATWGVYKKEQESAANTIRAQSELKKLQDRETLLDSELTRLQTDAGIEEEIRSKYSVSKPGENMIIIVDPAATSTAPVQPEESWWGKFKKWFK